jgi:hypothetical protein
LNGFNDLNPAAVPTQWCVDGDQHRVLRITQPASDDTSGGSFASDAETEKIRYTAKNSEVSYFYRARDQDHSNGETATLENDTGRNQGTLQHHHCLAKGW